MIEARGNPARWWRSRSCGGASRAPVALFISPFRRFMSVGTLVILLLIMAGVLYATNPRRLGKLAETLLSGVLGGRVTVGYAHLSLNGTLLLSDVELHTPGRDVAGIPHGLDRPLPVFTAEQIEARFDWLSLLSGHLSATQLIAIRPTLYLVEDPVTQRWNYENLRPPGGGGGGEYHEAAKTPARAQPVILLREACVMFGELHGDRIEQTSRTFVDGQFIPEPNAPAIYRFQITQQMQDEAHAGGAGGGGGGGGGGAGALVALGVWDVPNNRFDASMADVALSENVKRRLPRAVSDWCAEHHLSGKLSQLHVTFDNDDGLVVAMALDGVSFMEKVQPQPSEGAGSAKVFDVPIDDVHGNVIFGITRPGVKVSGLRGNVMKYRFEADADFRGTSAESPFDLSVRFPDATLSRDYPPLFIAVPTGQELWERTGFWGPLDFALSVKRLSWNGHIFFDGEVNCKGDHLRFVHFPYPLENLRGKIHFDNDYVTFQKVTANGDETPVLIEGDVPVSSRGGDTALTVTSTNATFDDRVGACLPEKFQPIWNDFSMRGHGAFTCRVSRTSEAEGESAHDAIAVDVTLDRGQGYMKAFPYRMDSVQGHLHFAGDRTTIDHLTARSGLDDSGRVAIDGEIQYEGGDMMRLKPELRVQADVPIDRALLGIFPDKLTRKLGSVEMGGRLGIAGTMERGGGAGTLLAARMNGDLTLKDASAVAKDGSFSLRDGSGSAHMDGGVLVVRNLQAVAEGIHLSANGGADLTAGTATLHMSAEGRDVALPAEAPALFPAAARAAWASYKPAGTIDLAASATVVMPNPSPAAKGALGADGPFGLEDASATLTAKSVSLANPAWGEPVTGITGKAVLAPDEVSLQHVHGSTGPVTFDVDATDQWGSGAWSLSGRAVSQNLPDKWLAKLPHGAVNFLSASKPAGQFQLTLRRLECSGTGKPWDFDGELAATGLTSTGPLSLGAKKMAVVAKGTLNPESAGVDMTGVLAGTDVSVSGKIVDTLTAKISATSRDKTLKFTDMDGKVAGGVLQGNIVVSMDKQPGYKADLSLHDAELPKLMLPATATDEERKKVGTGKVSATLALQQTFGDAGKGAELTGRGELMVRDGKIYNLPLALGLMQLVTLRLPVAQSFDQATMSYYLRDDQVTFEKILLESKGINLAGLGTLSLKDKPPTLDLNFVTESPSGFELPLISSFLNLTRNQLLQVSVTGSVESPKITPVPLNPIAETLKAILPHPSKENEK